MDAYAALAIYAQAQDVTLPTPDSTRLVQQETQIKLAWDDGVQKHVSGCACVQSGWCAGGLPFQGSSFPGYTGGGGI
jgi:hypothetical protein